MRGRIFYSFAGLTLVCVVVLAVLFGMIFNTVSRRREMASITGNAVTIASLLNHGAFENYEALFAGNIRITLISATGETLFDNLPGADLTQNRSDREEFIMAVQEGVGSATRPSVTFGADTFYHAVRLDDGSVLRLSRTVGSLGDVYPAFLPDIIIVTLAILVVAYILANRLTHSIVKPLANVDFSNISALKYEELWPFVQKINHQKQEINAQMAALKDRADTLSAIISNMREGLVILDKNGRILTVNQSVYEIFSLPAGHKMLNRSVQFIYRDATFIKAVKNCLAGDPAEVNFNKNEKSYIAILNPMANNNASNPVANNNALNPMANNNASNPVVKNITLNPVANENTSAGAVIFFLDITKARKAEAHRREFTANVSHELKTPLTVISAMTEMMQNNMVAPEDIPGFAGKMNAQAARLILLIDDIIRLSEFDERKAEKNFTTFNINETAHSVIQALQGIAADKNIMLTLETNPIEVTATPRLIEEMLFNLVDNGIKYNRDGGRVAVQIREAHDAVILSVTDTGIGIAAEHTPHIFERFYRVDMSRSKETGGTGLGLSIVKHIAEHHNATISMESTPSIGTKIEIRLAKQQE